MRPVFPSRFPATDNRLVAPPPTITEGFLPDLTAVEGRWLEPMTAVEGFLCVPPAVAFIADDGFRGTNAVEDRFFCRSPDNGRPLVFEDTSRRDGLRVRFERSTACVGARPGQLV